MQFLFDHKQISASDGVVLATENKASILYEDQAKIEKLSRHIGCVYSGMGPDYRWTF